MTVDSTLSIAQRKSAALIDEDLCIGCSLCLQACPYDAIVGAAHWMHTVITDACTGCALCLPPCPVDCIEMVPAPMLNTESVVRIREHEQQRALRLPQAGKTGNTTTVEPQVDAQTVQRALARACARLLSH